MTRHTLRRTVFFVSIVVTLIPINRDSELYACTGIVLTTRSGATLCGRTLEFAKSLDAHILFIPRNYRFTGIDPQGKSQGLLWKSRYAVVGANALHHIDIIDGINEKGLAGGLFYFTDYEYQTVPPHETARCIASWQLLTWILTTCASIAQVKTQLPLIRVGKASLPEWGIQIPIHVLLTDTTGACIVIEYIKGKLVLYDNPMGVLTNNPSFDWHMTNLRNYVNITNVDVSSLKLAQFSIMPTGSGSGMLGIPGDFTPPARFVRAVAFSHYTQPPATQQEAVTTLFHLLNLFDIPKGSVKTREDNQTVTEYTQWTSVSDTHTPTYYFHTYNNRNPRKVVLGELNPTHKTTITMPMEDREQPIVNVTSKLR